MSQRTVARGGSEKSYSYKAAINCAVFFLIISFIIAPLEPVFAQSTTDATTPSSDTSTGGTTAPDSGTQTSSNSSTVTPPASESAPTTNASPTSQPANSDTSITPNADTSQPTNSTQPTNATPGPNSGTTPATTPPGPPPPSGGVAGPNPQPVANGTFNKDLLKIDKNTGALSITYRISVPPGRNGLQPSVDLAYSSQDNQFGGIFGEGWSANIPYVERLNKGGVDQLYSTSTLNYFTSSLDGELVSTTTVTSTGATYIARTENGAFNKYTFASSTNQWTMIDKNGTQYAFGSASDSQQSDPNNSADVYKWMLKTITDTNGNIVTYNYFKDSGQIYPSSTIYDNTTSTTGIFEIDFLRQSNGDNATSSATGFAVNSNYRISEIDAKVNGTWVRKYALAYTTADNGSSTLLSSITESGQNASGTVVTLPATTFSYQTSVPGYTSSSTWNPPTTFVSDSGGSNYDTGADVSDVNGDALNDVLTGAFEIVSDAFTSGSNLTSVNSPYTMRTPASSYWIGGADNIVSSTQTNVSTTWHTTTSTDWIFDTGVFKVATTNGSSTGTSTISYVLDDNLSGTNIVTNASGSIVEVLDYYPYGQARLDSITAPYGGEKRKYIGQEYDAGTGLSYLQARYYSGSQGQFISEDPTFLAIGSQTNQENAQEKNTQKQLQGVLADPQQLNAYSYGRGNPIIESDPTGKCLEDLCIGEITLGIYLAAQYAPQIETAVVALYGLITGAQNAVQTFNNPQATTANKISSLSGIIVSTIGGLEPIGEFSPGENTVPSYNFEEPPIEMPYIALAELPQNAQESFAAYQENGWQSLKGYAGGGIFENREGYLPPENANYYREYDVNPSQGGVNRGTERFVVGQGGEVYYTNTHYGQAGTTAFQRIY